MSPPLKTTAEIAAFNEGVKTALDLAARTARRIGERSRRPLQEGFAAAALEEFAEAGVGLLIQAEEARRTAA